MSDDDKYLYEPTVRPREDEDFESEEFDSQTSVVLRISPEGPTPPASAGVEIIRPRLHEVSLVPGPDLVQ